MKMTTKMLAVAVMAVMAFAAFAVVGGASVNDADTSDHASCDPYYTVYIVPDEFKADSNITYGTDTSAFEITGKFNYDATKDSWPLTVKIYNSLWYMSSITYITVDGVGFPVQQDTNGIYISYVFNLDWNASENAKTLVIKDNSLITKSINFDMTGVTVMKYKVGTETYGNLDDALAAVTTDGYVEVLKQYTPSFNYGTPVSFNNGYNLTAGNYNVAIVTTAKIGDVDYYTKGSLSVVQENPAYCVYRAYTDATTAENGIIILQKWNLAPISIASIKCSDAVEYNGDEQEPTIVVTDVKGNVVDKKYYTVQYDGLYDLPENAKTYTVSLVAEDFNFKTEGVKASWQILPYDLSKGDRLKLTGADNLIYDGTKQIVSIVLNDTTKALMDGTVNKFNVTATTGDEVSPTDFTAPETYKNLTVKGSEAGTHTIYINVSSNFTSGIKGQPVITLTWTIAQKSIVGFANISWDASKNAVVTPTDDFVQGTDYIVKYVSNDGQREATSDQWATEKPYGTWYAVVAGIDNYTGTVQSSKFVIIADDDRVVYKLDAVSKADQGKSLRVEISPAFTASSQPTSAKLYVNYTTVKVVDGKYMYTSDQMAIPIAMPTGDETVSSVYVTFDAIFMYADVTMMYGSAPSSTTPESLITYDFTNTKIFKPGSSEWSEKSIVTIVDADGKLIEDAVLKVDDAIYKNGEIVTSGIQTVTSLKVAYVDKNGDLKDFDVSNYAIIDGKVLFDGKKFVVGGIVKPTEDLSVTVDKTKAKVDEVIDISFKDTKDVNFTVQNYKMSVVGTDETNVTVDKKNWTVTASEPCMVKLEWTFLNGQTHDKTFYFGGYTVSKSVVSYATDFPSADQAATVTVSSFDYSGVALANAMEFYQGETITLTVTPATGTAIDSVKLNSTPVEPTEGVYSIVVPTTSPFEIAVKTVVPVTYAVGYNTPTGAVLSPMITISSSVTHTTGTTDATIQINPGETVTLTIAKHTGYSYTVTFNSGSPITGSDTGNDMTYTASPDGTAQRFDIVINADP